ncbi:MAG: substrate-binding domain-containing protein [Planctomycetota bacterium]|jgi:ABC-type sugar transport system substrate-binding protein
MQRLSIALAFALSVGALMHAGCSAKKRPATTDAGAEDRSDQLYIMATMFTAHPVMQPDLRYFREKGDALGVRTLTVGPQAGNLEQYVETIEQAIAQKPDGLALNGLDVAIVDLIDKAMGRGIPVVLWDADLPMSKRITFIGTDWPQLGVRLAEALAPLVNRKGKVGRVGNVSQPHIMAAMDMFKVHMAKIAPEVEVLDVMDDEGRIEVAQSVASALIQRHPDIAGIAGFDGSSGAGICPAVKRKNKGKRKEDIIKVAINDLTPTHIEFLKDGSAQYVSGQKRNIFGPLALQVLYDIRNQGYAFTSSIESDAKLGIYQAPERIETGFIDVTTDTVAEFEKAQE